MIRNLAADVFSAIANNLRKDNPAARLDARPSGIDTGVSRITGRTVEDVSDIRARLLGEANAFDSVALPDFTPDHKAFRSNPFVYRALTAVGQQIASAPFIAETEKTVDGELQWTADTQSELAKFIKRPNPRESFDFLLWVATIALLGRGDTYFVYDKTAREIYYVNPEYMRPVISSDGKLVSYIGRNGGHSVPLDLEQVVHIKMPNPVDPFFGFSPIQPANQSLITHHAHNRFITRYFKSGSALGGVLSTERSVDEKLADQIRKEWTGAYGYEGAQHSVAVVGNGLAFTPTIPVLKDLAVPDIYKMSREQILCVFGVPPILVGILDDANRANSQEQMRIAWLTVFQPIQNLFVDALNLMLVSVHYGEKMRLRADNSKIDALQEDKNTRATRTVTLYRGDVITKNEAREEEKYEPVEGGDTFYSDQFKTDTGGQNNNADDTPPDDGNKSLANVLNNGVLPGKDAKQRRNEGIARQHDRRLIKYAPRLDKFMRSYFDAQADRIVDDLMRVTNGGKSQFQVGALYMRWLLKADDEQEANSRDIFNQQEERDRLKNAVKPIMRVIVKESGEEAIAEYNLYTQFNVDDPQVYTALVRFSSRLAENVTETTYNDIKRIIGESYNQGLSAAEIGRNIRRQFSTYTRSRAEMIARTESNGIVNSGRFNGLEQAGLEDKTWISTHDSITRTPPQAQFDHVLADGETVKINQPFLRTGEPLMHPGDPEGSAGNIIQCRCTFA